MNKDRPNSIREEFESPENGASNSLNNQGSPEESLDPHPETVSGRNGKASDGSKIVGRPAKDEKSDKRYTIVDHASDAAYLTALIPMASQILGLPKKSILRTFGDLAKRFTDRLRASYEHHSDNADELQEKENDSRETKDKLRGQLPDTLIDEKMQSIYRNGRTICVILLGLSFAATVIVVSSMVQANSTVGSLLYGLSIGLIATFGSIILKWANLYPLADYKKSVEILMVPVALFFFGLFVYQLTELYFYEKPAVEESDAAPDFSKFLSDGPETIAEPATKSSEIGNPRGRSLRWFYVGVLGSEMFASYALLSLAWTCSTLQPKAIVRAIWAQEEKMSSPRHRNRVKLRKSKTQISWLDYQSMMSQVPGKALRKLTKRFFK